MNYKHAFHAGNHTEVFKHSVLCLLLLHLRQKSKPFTVLDTHAGAGFYDLSSVEAEKTGEAQDGIARIIDKEIYTASPFLSLVRRLNPNGLHVYPGSPAIVQSFLREDDRLIACELRKDDAAFLRANFKNDSRVSIHHRNGYEAISAFVPLPTRRGLVLIDPPFERPDETLRLADGLNSGMEKWPTGIFVGWYPVKDRSITRELRARCRPANLPTLCCEFVREPMNGVTLVGSGLVICNPPWRFDEKLRGLCRELVAAFEERVGHYSVQWWIPERNRAP
jgi:23S rRNA (adenine2030-N6)-methyltransferase